MEVEQQVIQDVELLKRLQLALVQERSQDRLLTMVVQGLAALPSAALARIWLNGPGDSCESCLTLGDCPDHSRCLHLVASAGNPRVRTAEDWSRLNGRFRRVPLGAPMICILAAKGQGVELLDVGDREIEWLADPEWAKSEGVRGFVGLPLIFKGDVLGSLAAFFRKEISSSDQLLWLRLVADHAAAAIANARAFDQIARLKARLELENQYLREEVETAEGLGELIGQSPAMRNVIHKIELVAGTDASVLILGESGTGKELVAREIHRKSRRRDKPMVKVNCASIPRDLYESEFFGHAKGAFTGALAARAGRFQAADGGTLFLDEVGEIPPDLQSKLLRVLQEGQYERVGEEETRSVDVRIIAATNHDLKRQVQAGSFRQDLYYRLNVFPIEVAPLRNRLEDIPLLAEHFLHLASRKLGRPRPRLTRGNVVHLQNYDWPGNVRELQNIVERAVITSPSTALRFEVLQTHTVATQAAPASLPAVGETEPRVLQEEEIQGLVKANTLIALQRAGWRIYGPDGAADLLGIKPTTLVSRMQKLGLKKPPV